MRKFLLNLAPGETLSLVQELPCFDNLIKMDPFTSTYDQICDGFSLILPHISIAISMKAKSFFHCYINEPCFHGNNDEINLPHVITIKVG
jgi:hypothetical protein